MRVLMLRFDRRQRRRVRFWLLVTALLCATSCGGSSCEDPPPGSDPPEVLDPPELEDCVGLGVADDEFSGGEMYQCEGTGSPKMFMAIDCTGSVVCDYVDIDSKAKNLITYNFGEEDYDAMSIGACCNSEASDSEVETSCEFVCGAVVCDQMAGYLQWIRASDDEMRKLCCNPKEDGTYDCLDGNALLDVCRGALDTFIARVAETDGWGSSGNDSWVEYCQDLVAAGIPSPASADDYEYNEPCEGIYLGDADITLDDVIGDPVVSFRNTCVYPRCAISGSDEPGDSPMSCVSSDWNEKPAGWPEGAWTPKMDADIDDGAVFAQLSGGLGDSLADMGFSKSNTRDIVDGRVLYSVECEIGECEFVLNGLQLETEAFVKNGEQITSVEKRLKIYDSYMFLNRLARGSITEPDGSGKRYFSIPTGRLKAAFRSGAKGYIYGHITDEILETYFNETNKVMYATNSTSVEGYIDSAGRITFTQLEFDEGDLYLSIEFTSEIPNHAPEADAVAYTNICGEPTGLDAAASSDQDGDAIAYKWYWDGDIISTSASFDYLFPEGVQTVFLHVSDSGDLADGLPVTFLSMEDHIPPEIDAPEITVTTCLANPELVEIPLPDVSDLCSDPEDILLDGFVQSMQGYDAGMVPIVDGVVQLPVGQSVILWTAIDEKGNEANVEQIVNVVVDAGIQCCEVGQEVFEGDDDDDWFYKSASHSLPWCVLTYGGEDDVYNGANDDYIALGDADDYTAARSGSNTIMGEAGDDVLKDSSGNSRIYGGVGADDVYAGDGDDDVYGGYGDDHIQGQAGNDFIVPGPGADFVIADEGDDVVYVYHPCELADGEYLHGGDGGMDTLFLPVTLDEAEAMGVQVFGFEAVLASDPYKKGLSDCAAE